MGRDEFRAPSHSFVPDQTREEVNEEYRQIALFCNDDGTEWKEWDNQRARNFPYAAFPYCPRVGHPGQCLRTHYIPTKADIDKIMEKTFSPCELVPDIGLNPKPPHSHKMRGFMSANTFRTQGKN